MIRLIFFFTFLCICAPSWAGDIVAVRMGDHIDKTRIVIELTGALDFRAQTQSNPHKYISVTLPEKNWAIDGEAITSPPFTTISQTQKYDGYTTIDFNMTSAFKIKNAFMIEGNATTPHRLVIDVIPTTEVDFVASTHDIHGPLQIADKPQTLNDLISSITLSDNGIPVPNTKPTQQTPPKQASRPTKKPIIVIDAGHGGKDPGAISPSGIREKDITLPLAKKLAQILNQSGRYDAKLTRSDDRYIKLYNRVKIARNAKADLFISIHADSVGNAKTRGASIYTLSNTASDKQTAKLAARENRADLIGGLDLNVEDEDVSAILIDLSMRETMNQSKNLANGVVQDFRSSGIETLKGPHRYAGFAVLKAPDVPSILIETGFVSNESQARELKTPRYQSKLSTAILKSLDQYFGYK